MSWYNPTTWFKAKALPLEINVGNADMLARHVGRLSRLYAAEAQGKGSKEIRAEIAQRKKAIEAHGHAAPRSVKEARALWSKVKE